MADSESTSSNSNMRFGCKVNTSWLFRWLSMMLLLPLLWQAALGKECKDEATWCQEHKEKRGCRVYPAYELYLRNCMETCGICDPVSNEFTCTVGYYRSGDTCRPCRQMDDHPICNASCPKRKHGQHCNYTCGHCVEDGCQRWTGLCDQGCEEGWTGVECKGLDPTGRFYITFDLLAVTMTCLLAATIVITTTTVVLCITCKRRLCCCRRGRKDFSPIPLPVPPVRRKARAEDEEPLYSRVRFPAPRYRPRKPRPHLGNRVPVGHLPYIRRSISVDDLTYLSSRTLRFSQQPSLFQEADTSDLGASNESEDAMFLDPSPYMVYFSKRNPEQNDGGADAMKVEPSPVIIYMSRRAAQQMADRDHLRLDGIRSFAGYMDMTGTEVPLFLPFRLWPAQKTGELEDVEDEYQGGSSNADSGLGSPDGNFQLDLSDEVPLPIRHRDRACAVM